MTIILVRNLDVVMFIVCPFLNYFSSFSAKKTGFKGNQVLHYVDAIFKRAIRTIPIVLWRGFYGKMKEKVCSNIWFMHYLFSCLDMGANILGPCAPLVSCKLTKYKGVCNKVCLCTAVPTRFDTSLLFFLSVGSPFLLSLVFSINVTN